MKQTGLAVRSGPKGGTRLRDSVCHMHQGNYDMNIKGTGKNDSLHGLATNDTISGGKGNDLLWGHGGNDTLIGGAGADVFVMNSGGGEDTIVDFNPAEGDVVVFSYDTALDAMFIRPLSDGMAWTSDSGGQCWVKAGDYNGDGQIDTEIYVNDVSVCLLGWAPDQLTGQMFLGG